VGLEIKGDVPSDPDCIACPEADRNSAVIPDDDDAEFAGNLTVSPRIGISVVSGILWSKAVGGMRRKGAMCGSLDVADSSSLSRDIAFQPPLGS
jgi:hypothetical protein